MPNRFLQQSRPLLGMNHLRTSAELPAIIIEVFVVFLVFCTQIRRKYVDINHGVFHQELNISSIVDHLPISFDYRKDLCS
jgi:hypothetical protein